MAMGRSAATASSRKSAGGAGGGIRWSAPVLVKKAPAGLTVVVPDRVVEALTLGPGDVLNFTELPDGSIEVWMVKKGTYSSLGDMAAVQPAVSAKRRKPADRAKRGAKR